MIDRGDELFLQGTKDILPPGPWHAQGNKVMAGDVNVATVFAGRRPAATARAIADLYKLLDLCVTQEETIAGLRAQVEELTDKLSEMSEGCQF
jgi:hypothetical protein